MTKYVSFYLELGTGKSHSVGFVVSQPKLNSSALAL